MQNEKKEYCITKKKNHLQIVVLSFRLSMIRETSKPISVR